MTPKKGQNRSIIEGMSVKVSKMDYYFLKKKANKKSMIYILN
jgi:hypothetical protein